MELVRIWLCQASNGYECAVLITNMVEAGAKNLTNTLPTMKKKVWCQTPPKFVRDVHEFASLPVRIIRNWDKSCCKTLWFMTDYIEGKLALFGLSFSFGEGIPSKPECRQCFKLSCCPLSQLKRTIYLKI